MPGRCSGSRRERPVPLTVALLALQMHLADRLDGRPVRSFRVAAIFALSLLFAETSLGARRDAGRGGGARCARAGRRAGEALVAPTALLAAVYLIVYSTLGYGVVGAGGGTSINPEPLEFGALPARWMTLVAEALIGLLSELTLVIPGLIRVTGALGAVALALVGYAVLHPDARRSAPSLRRGARRGIAGRARPDGRGNARRGRLRARRGRRGAGHGGARRLGTSAQEAPAARATHRGHGARSALPPGPGRCPVQGIEGGAADRQRPVTACPIDATGR